MMTEAYQTDDTLSSSVEIDIDEVAKRAAAQVQVPEVPEVTFKGLGSGLQSRLMQKRIEAGVR